MIEADDAIDAEMETVADDWQQTLGDIRLPNGLWFEAVQSGRLQERPNAKASLNNLRSLAQSMW